MIRFKAKRVSAGGCDGCLSCRPLSSRSAKLQPHTDFLKGEPHRKHPGVTNLKTLRLPEKLQVAARSIIHREYTQIKGLDVKAQNLVDFLWSRKRKVEDGALRQKALNLERELWSKVTEKHRDVDEQLLEERIQKKVLSELRRTTYHWKQLKFDEELGVIYMAARLAGGYAAVRRALNEIKKRDESFCPESLLDFGSGLGTVAWASHSCWPDSLKEMVCVDSSGPMNTLAERLLKGDNEKEEPHFKHVYFRQFLPVSPKVQFDLVVSAFTLSELPRAVDREDAVFTLWRKTNRYLVLVENGTKEGHQILMEARDTLLNMFFLIYHTLLQLFNFVLQQICHLTEKFSYVILTRTDVDSGLDSGLDWARLIAPVLPRTRHVHCRMCCSDGQLQHVVVTPRKHGRDVYRCARSSDWGDQVPVVQIRDGDEQSGSEEP
uniref:Ribosome assembly protein METTL17, mitochondrial n=1 Tax=Periophthalmus magnuspinnatus TaxID=409849 RepID=A0A3B3ZNF3_9GOBI